MFHDRWPIVFFTIPIWRSLACRNPTIPFYDRWPIGFNDAVSKIFSLLEYNNSFLRSMVDRLERSLLNSIVGESQSTDPLYTNVEQSESNDTFLRALPDGNPTIHVYDRWTLIYSDPFLYDRWPIGFNGPLFSIVGQSNDFFSRSLTDRNPMIPVIERCPMRIRRSDFSVVGRSFLSIPF